MKYILLKVSEDIYKQLAKLKIDTGKNWANFFLDNYLEVLEVNKENIQNDNPTSAGQNPY